MAKTKSQIKRSERGKKVIKDKAIVNFLLEHMKPVELDFSKIRVPSFTFFLENEEKNFSDLNKLHLFKKKDEIKFFKMSSKNFAFDDLKK